VDDKAIQVLLVEDDDGDAYLLQEYLAQSKKSRFRVVLANRLDKAIPLLAESAYDIILLDLSLPDASGLDTFEKMHAAAEGLPIVVLSGLMNDAVVVQAMQAGAQDYLVKGQTDSDGVIRSLLYSIERKHIETALRASENLYRTLVEISPDPIVYLDMDLLFIFANPQIVYLLGLQSIEQIRGRSILDSVVPEDRKKFRESVDLATESGSIRNVEMTFFGRNKNFLGEVSLKVVYDSANRAQGYIGVIRDVTERKQMESVLLSSQKLASLGTLAAGVAHEINSPLQVITGMSESLLKRSRRGNLEMEHLYRDLETINRSGWRVAEIVRSLLAYARISTDQVDLYDLNILVHDSLLLIEHQLKSWSNIIVVTELTPDLKPLRCDRNKITQVLINLLTNARDAMPQGGEITIRTAYDGKTQKYILQISDDGNGIPEAIREKKFDPFYTTKAVGKGTGLGLSIVQSIVQAHGGDVFVESTPGQGTTFTILLPSINAATNLPEGNSSILSDLNEYISGRFDD